MSNDLVIEPELLKDIDINLKIQNTTIIYKPFFINNVILFSLNLSVYKTILHLRLIGNN
jgi:hypothetical protein